MVLSSLRKSMEEQITFRRAEDKSKIPALSDLRKNILEENFNKAGLLWYTARQVVEAPRSRTVQPSPSLACRNFYVSCW